MVRPGQVYRLAVTILQERFPLSVRASIQRNGVEIAAASSSVKKFITESLIMRVSVFKIILNKYSAFFLHLYVLEL